jgi:hypothetical protein
MMVSGQRPVAMCYGSGHVVVHGNAGFVAAFGRRAVGMPAREALVELPSGAFDLFDRVLTEGRPLAASLRRGTESWRLVCKPRMDPESGEVYGITFHLRERSDVTASVW